jgi:hypothetical protein
LILIKRNRSAEATNHIRRRDVRTILRRNLQSVHKILMPPQRIV